MDRKFYAIKKEVRILGIDDGPFKRDDDTVLVVGVVSRGGSFIDGVLSTRVKVDGLDSTEVFAQMVSSCKFKDLRVIMLDGLGFGGFNLVDVEELNRKTGLPVVVVVRDMPDFDEIDRALDNLPDKQVRSKLIKKAGRPFKVETRKNKFIHLQTKGIRREDAEAIVKLSATRSLIPEPIRVAHLIASGIVLGESRGSA